MKVLITGANGFLGKCIYDYNKDSHVISTLSRSIKSTISNDLSSEIPSIENKFDLVVHSAGKAHIIPKTQEEEEAFFRVNYEGTINLCKGLEGNLPNTFVFISTIAVYGRDVGKDILESDPLDGYTPYGKSKIKAEKFLTTWCDKNNVNLVILRLPLIAGANPKGNLESMINGIKKGYYFNISGNTSKKSIILSSDVAKLIPTLLGCNGIYNLSGDKDYTFEEVSIIISTQLSNKKVRKLPYFLVFILSKMGDVFSFMPIDSLKLSKMMSDLTVSSEKAKLNIGWNPSILDGNFKIK